MKIYVTVKIFFLLFCIRSCVSCIGRKLRLLSNGTLQICTHNQWRCVCSEDWGNLDTAVACRQLGYDGGYMNRRDSLPYGTALDYRIYHCTGRENTLSSCVSRTATWCTRVVNITCVHRNASDLCTSGDIRLWGGNATYEGNIEVCTNRKVWSTISDSHWGNEEAVVACRQLGYSNSIAAIPITGSKFGQRYQPMEFGGLSCSGREHDLNNCTVSTSFVNTWSKHFFSNIRGYAGVRCLPKSNVTCSNGAVRLIGGYASNNGIAEICTDGVWAGICEPHYRRMSFVSHICNALNYPRYTKIDKDFFQLNKHEPMAYVSLDEHRCRLDSAVLLDCVRASTTYGISYTASCSSYGVLCCPNETCTIQPQEHTTITISPSMPESTLPNPTIGIKTIYDSDIKLVNFKSSSIYKADQREYSLQFDTLAASLISTYSVDLRGLEKDIETKVLKCISDKYEHFTSSALEDGVFYLNEKMLYKGKFSPLGDIPADTLVLQLKKCVDIEPWIEYYNTDLRLHVSFGP